MTTARSKYTIGIFGNRDVGKTTLHQLISDFFVKSPRGKHESKTRIIGRACQRQLLTAEVEISITDFPSFLEYDDSLSLICQLNMAFVLIDCSELASTMNLSLYFKALTFLADFDCHKFIVGNVFGNKETFINDSYGNALAAYYSASFFKMNLKGEKDSLKNTFDQVMPEDVQYLTLKKQEEQKPTC